MKTLKQLLQEKWIEKYGVNSVTQPPVDYELIAVKEWLTQKRQKCGDRDVVARDRDVVAKIIYKSLLEELNQC